MIAQEPRIERVEELVLQLKGLVLVRDLLRQRGVSRQELDEHTDEIGRVRSRLAELVQRS